MANRTEYEIALEIGGRVDGSLGRAVSKYNKGMRGMGNSTDDLKADIKDLGATMATIGTTAAALVASGVGAVILATDDLNRSLNGLESSTGKSAHEMAGMRDVMLDVYKNNFGEDFDDIGKSMGLIARQTKESGKQLQLTTENALLMRDTFEIEVSESIKGANQLMKNFAVDSNTAYNLMAQGAQAGLNANQNLVDVMNEYSVHFSQLGLNAEDMFNMISSGAESGVFDIDKLGDAIKEFGIRAKDGSKASVGALKDLGLNAKGLIKNFNKGGKEGRKAFETVTKKLNALKSETKKNEIGTALFGTMWEDVGAKGIKALTQTEGKINANRNALEKMNAVKYDTFTEGMAGIGRIIHADLIIPIADKLLPHLEEFGAWSQENVPIFIDGIFEAADSVKDFAGDVKNFIRDYKPLVAGLTAGAAVVGIYTVSVKAATLASTAAVIATGAFAGALAFVTSPLGIVAIAIGALTAGSIALYNNWDTVTAFMISSWEAVKTVFAGIGEWFVGIWDGAINGIKGGINSTIGMANNLIDKLNNLHVNIPDWVPVFGGKTIGVNIDRIPELYKGTNFHSGGPALIGERGPEILDLPRGSRVTPNNKISDYGKNMAGNRQESIVYAPVFNVTGKNKEEVAQVAKQSFNEFKRFYKKMQQDKRRVAFN